MMKTDYVTACKKMACGQGYWIAGEGWSNYRNGVGKWGAMLGTITGGEELRCGGRCAGGKV